MQFSEDQVSQALKQPDWTENLSPAARKYYERFIRNCEKRRNQVRSVPLIVLIWGPGDSALPRLYRKRTEIRDTLRDMDCPALFSEELQALSGPDRLSARAEELIQAVDADLIVLIYGSFGSVAEFHDFSPFRKIASKMLVFIDSKHVEGYGFQGALKEFSHLYRSVEVFEYPKDIEQCNLRTAILGRVDTLRVAKWSERFRK